MCVCVMSVQARAVLPLSPRAPTGGSAVGATARVRWHLPGRLSHSPSAEFPSCLHSGFIQPGFLSFIPELNAFGGCYKSLEVRFLVLFWQQRYAEALPAVGFPPVSPLLLLSNFIY